MIIFNDVLLSVMSAATSDCAIFFPDRFPNANSRSARFTKTKVSEWAYAGANSSRDECGTAPNLGREVQSGPLVWRTQSRIIN